MGFFAVFWLSSLWTEGHYWVLDMLKGEGACGNKFKDCRPWN